MNETQVTFTGWLGTDVTLREVSGGQQVASFRVATTARRFKDGEWVTTSTTWHTVKAWNRLAGHVAQSLRKGDPVLVHGRLVADVWTKPEGETVTSYVVVATSVGHDMCQGTTIYTKPVAPAERFDSRPAGFAPPQAAPAPQQAAPLPEEVASQPAAAPAAEADAA